MHVQTDFVANDFESFDSFHDTFDVNSHTSYRLTLCHFILLKMVTTIKKSRYVEFDIQRCQTSLIVKPRSAMTESFEFHNSFVRKPDRLTISLSEMEPGYSWEINVTAPDGAIPTRPLYVTWCL